MQLNEVLIGVERVLQTPLPIAYSIAISQITWVYVMMLPFQLWDDLQWVTIPGCIFGAYIILGIAAIGREIENPFGHDVNDLPLEDYCNEVANDIDIITSSPPPRPSWGYPPSTANVDRPQAYAAPPALPSIHAINRNASPTNADSAAPEYGAPAVKGHAELLRAVAAAGYEVAR